MQTRWIHSTFLASLALLLATYILSYFNLGAFSLFLALTLSGLKAVFIAVFFMELKHQKFLVKAVAPLSIVWALTLFTLAFADYFTR